ncbi:MAG: hypothetical protein PHH24_00690 [Candidatus Moranbacteria bacterium]|jgi:hypothetical protein|nr:hypothetical protein [Candidatus Moranbacteria bacterium]MDD5652387.1 hypothetical protein [Candidatus Moranbacteria bacterium]MDX9855777.1 hypothetical protein [Candidatus Moranbacteria bacterium]
MEESVLNKLENQEKKIDEIYKSVEKTRKYFLWTLIISAGAILIPLVGLMIIVPWFLKAISSAYSGLGI